MTIGKLSGQCDFGQKGQSYCNQRGQSCVAKRVKVAWLFHWHMNKKYWISVYFNQDVPDIMIKELVGKSYEIVVRSLSKKEREKLTSDDD